MSDPKCWWRYNNSGGRYMTCNYNQNETSGKPPPKQKPRMTPEQFVDKVGVNYGKMSNAQKNEYHRLDMALRRANDRKLYMKNIEEVKKIKKEYYDEQRKIREQNRTKKKNKK